MEVVASIVGGVVVETGRLFFGCIHSTTNTVKVRANLDALEKGTRSLSTLQDELINQSELAMRKGKVPDTPVTEWIKTVEEFLRKVHQIQAVNLPRHSLNFSKRNRISKKVVEMLKEIERLILAGGSHLGKVAVSCSAPTVVEHIPGPPIRDQTMASTMLAKTMTLLSDDGVGRIGVWGMGGIGKTTLVRNLNNELKNTSMQPFSIVIWITVSRNSDVSKVQREIAARLNLGARMGESVERMAIQLHHRLEEEKFLLILDDVWEKIDLDGLGIPQPEVQKGSKIILTSRFLDVCRYMMTDVELKVDCLGDEEAWQLFTRHAGNVVSLEHIRPFAEAITRECCGLPLAIIIVGAAMRGKTMVQLWEHALYELQRSVPCIGSVEDKVYKPLKWSYDSLEGKNKKPCFLYCALFPEDFSIEISELVWCWRAEGLIDEQENYEDSFNRGISLIENLKDSCLLEDGARQGTVKMHDVVRDVAIWISSSSEDGCKSLVRSGISLSEISAFELSNSLKRVSFMKNKIIRLPDCVLQCSGASTLLLQGNPPLDIIPERFLQGFEALRVLNMSGTRIQSLPLSLLQLGDLRALLLRDCFSLEELPSLEGLSRLEVLDLSATAIGELPGGTGNLSNLRQLNLSGLLKTIQAGILSKLSCLEVLDMTLSGYQLRVKRVSEIEQASFEELGCLERLLALCIRLKRIPCPDSEDFSWINRLKRFQLFIGPEAISLKSRHDTRMVTIGGLDLSGERIGWLLGNASSLVLCTCWGLNEMLKDLVINNVGSFAGLKSLTIARSDSSFARRGGGHAVRCDLLPNLEELHLEQLTCIESISELVEHLGLRFLRLKLMEVTRCKQMKNLLCCGFSIITLPRLEVIKISYCPEFEALFNCHAMQGTTPDSVVPNLRKLKLEDVPKLRTLCRDQETWPRLEQAEFINCNRLRKLPLTEKNADNIQEIRGETEWWDGLTWDTDSTKSSLQPYFHPAEPRVSTCQTRSNF